MHIYRDYTIHFDPPPIPIRSMDWHFAHINFDGAEDSGDRRCGHAASLADCKHEIDDMIADEALAALDRAIAEAGKPLTTVLEQHYSAPGAEAKAAAA